MQNLLPTLFIVLGACALILTLFWLWMSLRHTLAHVEEAQVAAVDPTSSPRAALLAEKQSLLVALKDLEAERDNGKLSEADFTELNARYRARARSVLKQLDAQIAPHREAAKAMLNAAGEVPQAEAVATPSTAVASAATTQVCESCSTSNDADATFCKKCGARLQAEAKS
jgi:ribosomal protein L40E